eukprot:CAMPEP_0175808554 /NCGR_PEP_ID=MMETSP0107_2-20121207/2321_1 /TAXON_ID=195067 ORGANISM="Goniomonas pacifica, Strain CCMP1869" /NCGR_SAMPLE_ID=MMETSP0107_2 /ASSEMBLY_ACC=CAM_ASM_000203 /LENGTH=59 /DNA_ID=CAMNT_0017120189 /DNA_START=267 /DNA_END=446 /DNA_ORIENTATION=-
MKPKRVMLARAHTQQHSGPTRGDSLAEAFSDPGILGGGSEGELGRRDHPTRIWHKKLRW